MKREVSICDVCGKKIASHTCELCGADTCNDKRCGNQVGLLFGSGLSISKFYRCNKCHSKLSRLNYNPDYNNNLITTETQNNIKIDLVKSLTMAGIEGTGKTKK